MPTDNEIESGEPFNPNVLLGITAVCIVSGFVFVSAFALPSLVGSVLTTEMVLGAGMAFAASFLIVIALIPEDTEEYGTNRSSP